MINKYLLGIFVTLFAIFNGTQLKAEGIDSLNVSFKKGLYSVSSFSPDICFITVKIRPDESGKHHNWEHYYINQKVNSGFRFAQMIGWQKNRHWGFEAGAELSRKVMDVDFGTNENIPEVRLKNEFAVPIYYRTIFNTINVPVRVVFTGGRKKLKFFSFFGINKTFAFNIYQEQLTYDNAHIASKSMVKGDIGAKKVFSASDWGAGIKYNITPKVAFRLNAAVQRSYASVKSSNKKILFWSTGISFGYVYSW